MEEFLPSFEYTRAIIFHLSHTLLSCCTLKSKHLVVNYFYLCLKNSTNLSYPSLRRSLLGYSLISEWHHNLNSWHPAASMLLSQSPDLKIRFCLIWTACCCFSPGFPQCLLWKESSVLKISCPKTLLYPRLPFSCVCPYLSYPFGRTATSAEGLQKACC